MISNAKTRDVPKAAYANFLKKARECFHAAEKALAEKEWNAAAINAIHCSICACDAMCVYFLGKRHSGESHNDAVAVFKTIKSSEEFKTNANRLLRILRMKNMAEYEERLVYPSEAEKIHKDCERFLRFVEDRLKT
jgi:HEPN domain-containing protein